MTGATVRDTVGAGATVGEYAMAELIIDSAMISRKCLI